MTVLLFFIWCISGDGAVFSGKLFFKAPDAQDGAGDAGDGPAGKKDGKDHRSLSDVSGSVSVKIYPYGSIPEREAGPDIKGRGMNLSRKSIRRMPL